MPSEMTMTEAEEKLERLKKQSIDAFARAFVAGFDSPPRTDEQADARSRNVAESCAETLVALITAARAAGAAEERARECRWTLASHGHYAFDTACEFSVESGHAPTFCPDCGGRVRVAEEAPNDPA